MARWSSLYSRMEKKKSRGYDHYQRSDGNQFVNVVINKMQGRQHRYVGFIKKNM